MIPVMVTLMHHLRYGDDPLHPLFWFIMGMATIAGGITAYPVNSWLVRRKLKHGCMTLPEAGAAPVPEEHGHHAMGLEPAHQAMAGGPEGHAHHEIGTLPTGQAAAMIGLTFVCLLVAAWLTSAFLAPISFS
jgi:hypothetical protein